LESGNNQWATKKNIIIANISQLNFPTEVGGIGNNTIQIKIDSKNKYVELSNNEIGCQAWAAEIDFIAIQYSVIDPFILIPGFGGDPKRFNDNQYKEYLMNTYGIPSEVISYAPLSTPSTSYFICDAQNQNYEENLSIINQQVLAIADNWKTDSLNIIGHSKGGLESLNLISDLLEQQYTVNVGQLNNLNLPSTLTINTLTTLGTPYKGTLLADWVTKPARTFTDQFSVFKEFMPSLCDLQVDNATIFTEQFHFGESLRSIMVAADADTNSSGRLSLSEIEGSQLDATSKGWSINRAALSLIIGNFAWRITAGPVHKLVINPPYNIPFLIQDSVRPPNDIMVKVASSNSGDYVSGGYGIWLFEKANHGTIVSNTIQDRIINQFKTYSFLGRDEK